MERRTKGRDVNKILFASVCMALLGGCSEVRDETDVGMPDVPATLDTGVPGTDAPMVESDTPSVPTDTPSSGENVVAINEIYPDGEDWVELVNAGTTAVDLEGMSIVDGDDTHDPVAFPAGATLAPGARYLVGFDIPCEGALPAGLGLTERCIATTYGISGSSGDTIRVIDGLTVADGVVVATVTFPGSEAAGLVEGETYCRLPDATGDFAPCTSTLDAVNAGR
jgi:hypothetical protein